MCVHDRLERVVTEIINLRECVDLLSDVRDCEEIIDIINDKVAVLCVERDELHRRIEQADDRDAAALRREYYKSVL